MDENSKHIDTLIENDSESKFDHINSHFLNSIHCINDDLYDVLHKEKIDWALFEKKLAIIQDRINYLSIEDGDTPYGNYSPDWAVVCKKEGLKNPDLGIYFIVETKAGKAEANLQDVERNKIKCGKLHFAAVSSQIKFDWVNSYQDFIQKFGVEDSGSVLIETMAPHDPTDTILAYTEKLSE
ncbi:MAG: hypothetical protein IJU43_07635 [Lachnospiraceae bacterium]|nr:hypothetical protein [Lachnospiraceae bacterium]